MNEKNMKVLLDNYMNHMPVMNDSLHDEVYKWDAVRYFQDNWDIDEDNFGAMFENAVSLAANIINTTSRPGEGIVEIAKYEDEAVRSLFRDLFLEDGGDLKVRDEKISDFIDKSEELRKQYADSKWKYAQDYRSAVTYLSLYSPDDNFLYLPDEAHHLKECMEYEDFGNGKTFSLLKYYKMCDAVTEQLKARKDILATHDGYLRETSYPDASRHILTSDFIYCAEKYQLYDNIKITKHSKASNKDADAHELKIADLEKKCAELKQSIERLKNEIELLSIYNINGLEVNHKKYGAGVIAQQEKNHIVVDFSGTQKQFLLPEAFANKFLRAEKQEVMDHFENLAAKIKEEKQQQNLLNLAQYDLEQEL